MVALSAGLLTGRVDPGGGPVPTRLVPADLDAVGRRFATGQHDLDTAVGALAAALGGVGGMAGDDDPGREFAAAYDPAGRSAFAAFAAGVTALGGVAQGLVASAANHAVADAHSTAGGAAPDGAAPVGVVPPSAPRSVPSAAGGRSGGFVLPGRLADFWPAGDPEQLRAAARAWRQAAATTADLGGGLHGAITGLVGNNTGPALGLVERFWGRIWGTADAPVLSAAVSGCGALAVACDAYAQHIDDVRGEVEEIAAEVVAVTAAGLLLTIVTAGASDAVAAAGDAALIARAAEGVRQLVELTHLASVPLLHAAPQLDLAARAAPQLVVSSADTVQVTKEVADQMAAAEAAEAGLGPGVVTVAPVPLSIERSQVEKKYEQHAQDFGVSEPRGRKGFVAVEKAVKDVVSAPGTVHILGTYRGQPVILNYDKDNRRVVIQSRGGRFVSGWVLNQKQEANIVSRGSL